MVAEKLVEMIEIHAGRLAADVAQGADVIEVAALFRALQRESAGAGERFEFFARKQRDVLGEKAEAARIDTQAVASVDCVGAAAGL